MGLSNLFGGQTMPGAMAGGSMDMSILSTIALPDPEAQRKYEAMGLPDPVAFAALTALGAIPNPMAMLNKMMSAAQDRIDRDLADKIGVAEPKDVVQRGAAVNAAGLAPASGQLPSGTGQLEVPKKEAPLAIPPGKSFVEAFRDLQRAQGDAAQAPSPEVAIEVERLEERLAKQAREAEQARIAADRAREAAQMAAANRDASGLFDPESLRGSAPREAVRSLAGVFTSGNDDEVAEEAPPGKPQLQTLSSLLTGRQASQDGFGPVAASSGSGGPEKICIGRLPRGVTESAVRLECARHGAVTSVILEGDGSAAYVTFAQADMAATAMRRLAGRAGLFGSTEAQPLQVRLISEIPDSVRLAAAMPGGIPFEEPVDPADLPEYLRPREDRKKKKSRSRRRSRSRSRGRKKRSRSRRGKRQRSRSMVRWLDRSRSNSHTATGQYIRATGCSSTVRWWEKKKENSSSSSSDSSRSRKRKSKADDDARRPRQVAVKGNWAQFVQNGQSYYYNVINGKTLWERPTDFEEGPSRRPAQAASAGGGTRPTSCFL